MTSLIVFKPNYDEIPRDKWGRADRHTSFIGDPGKLGMSQRLPDYRTPVTESDATHWRHSPWIILDDGQSYSADLPGYADFDEVVVFRLGYSPVEGDNPWQPLEIEYKGADGCTQEQLKEMGLSENQIKELQSV